MNKIMPVLLFLCLISIASADLTTIEKSCLNSTHYSILTELDGNLTTNETNPCYYGCDLNTNTCFDMDNDTQFLFLLLAGITVVIFSSLAIFYLISEDYSWIKLLLLALSLYLQFYLLNSIASITEQYVGVVSTFSKGFMLIATAYSYIVFFIIFMLLIKMIIGMIAAFTGRNNEDGFD